MIKARDHSHPYLHIDIHQFTHPVLCQINRSLTTMNRNDNRVCFDTNDFTLIPYRVLFYPQQMYADVYSMSSPEYIHVGFNNRYYEMPSHMLGATHEIRLYCSSQEVKMTGTSV